MIKGLVFDLDGVITETASLHYLAWKEEVAKIGLDYTKEQNSSLKGLNRIDTLKEILKLFKKELKEDIILEMANNKNTRYKELLQSKISEKDILPGVKSFLDEAKKNNLKLAIASSSYNAPLILKKINLYDYFDFIVDPATITNGKPDPEIFIKATEGLNLSTNQVIGFEDAVAGVSGLKDAGIKTVAITHGEKEDWSKADIVLNSTSELNLTKIIK